jgi:transporter family-2 protein
MNVIAYLIAVASGAANPLEAGSNAELNKQLGSPVWAGLFVYGTGLLGLLLAQAVMRQAWPGSEKIAGVTWWAWCGG